MWQYDLDLWPPTLKNNRHFLSSCRSNVPPCKILDKMVQYVSCLQCIPPRFIIWQYDLDLWPPTSINNRHPPHFMVINSTKLRDPGATVRPTRPRQTDGQTDVRAILIIRPVKVGRIKTKKSVLFHFPYLNDIADPMHKNSCPEVTIFFSFSLTLPCLSLHVPYTQFVCPVPYSKTEGVHEFKYNTRSVRVGVGGSRTHISLLCHQKVQHTKFGKKVWEESINGRRISKDPHTQNVRKWLWKLKPLTITLLL